MPRPSNPHRYGKIWQDVVAIVMEQEDPPARMIIPGKFESLRLEWYCFRDAHEKQAQKVRKWGDEKGFERHMQIVGRLNRYAAIAHEQGLMLEHTEAQPEPNIIISAQRVATLDYVPPPKQEKVASSDKGLPGFTERMRGVKAPSMEGSGYSSAEVAGLDTGPAMSPEELAAGEAEYLAQVNKSRMQQQDLEQQSKVRGGAKEVDLSDLISNEKGEE